MPLPLRIVNPPHVSRGTLPDRFPVQNDLEAVANGTLSNVILQLSSLSQHAEELFTSLIRVGTEIAGRASNLQARIDRLAVKVIQLDGQHEESSMHESLNTKPFQSSMTFDQQVVVRTSLSVAMMKTYAKCDRAPPLENLNKFRDDGKDGLKFYTDPSYFFDLWRQEMLKDTEKKAIRKLQSMDLQPHKPKDNGARIKKRPRVPNLTRERQRNIAIEQGEHIMNHADMRAQNSIDVNDSYGDGSPSPQYGVKRESSLEPPEPPFTNGNGNGLDNNIRGYYGNGGVFDQYDAYAMHQAQQAQADRLLSRHPPPPSYASSIEGYSNRQSPRGPLAALANGFNRPLHPPPAPPPNYIGSPPTSSSPHAGTPTRGNRMGNSRETLPPPPPPPVEDVHMQMNMNGHHGHGGYGGYAPMPPPMSMIDDNENDEPLPPPPPTPDQYHNDGGLRVPGYPEDHLPPSPPPPPPETAPAPPPPPPVPIQPSGGLGSITAAAIANGGLALKPTKKNPPPKFDGRSELLKAIRDGIELRKVDNNKGKEGKEEKGSTYCDVASILARRVAVEMSDSEDSESDYDSDWDETSA